MQINNWDTAAAIKSGEVRTNASKQAKDPLISVIMPVYNSETFLAEAIESILSQTFWDFELLIIYDDSADSSFAIIERYQKLDSRIRVIVGEKKSLIGALNQGIDAARGECIARMDADDISHPQRFEKQVRLLESAGADICGCHWFVINAEGRLTEAKIAPLCKHAFTIFLACGTPFAHGSVMIRADFIQRHALRYGGVNYAEDYDLWTRCWEKGATFANADDFLFKYRDFDASLSKRESKGTASEAKTIRRRFVRRNSDACLHAISEMTKCYASLSQTERVFLLLASYLVSLNTKRLIVIGVIKQSARRSIGIAILYLLRGV